MTAHRISRSRSDALMLHPLILDKWQEGGRCWNLPVAIAPTEIPMRRGQVIAAGSGSTDNGRSPIISGRRQPSGDGTSRMNREAHVRICERLGVKFPGPTRQLRSFQ
jgi:hypothetical protein